MCTNNDSEIVTECMDTDQCLVNSTDNFNSRTKTDDVSGDSSCQNRAESNSALHNITALNSDVVLNDNIQNDCLHANTDPSMSAQTVLNLTLSAKGLNIGHLNVQGIQNKLDQVSLMLNNSENNICILGLSETKLKDFHPDSYFFVDNYQFFRRDRVITRERQEQGGGIIVYVKNGMKVERRKDLETNEIECVWLEVFPKMSSSFLVGTIYRHPNDGVEWNENFEILIEKVLEKQKEIYLLGDFNRDLLNENTKKAWLEYMEPFGLHQKVNCATRITSHSQTLIDHIYCNVQENISSVKVPKIGISDHFPIFLTRKTNNTTPKSSHYTITYRSYKNFKEQEFLNELQSSPWDVIKVFDNVNDVVETWSSMFMEIVNRHLPLKKHRVKHKHQPKWLTSEIIEAMKTRDHYKSLNDDVHYKIWRNRVGNLIKQSKKTQYTAILNENQNNPGSIWKLFKELRVNKKSKAPITSLKINSKETEDCNEIVNEFNKFFVSIASNLKEPTEHSNFDKLKTFCDGKVPPGMCFSIPEISKEKVQKFLKNIDITKATGCDNIGPRLLKIAAPFIADSITYICNQSIRNSQFPDTWKKAKVTPLHKNGPGDDINNYRPISILPVVSKVLEKHIHDSLMTFLTEHHLLHKTQSGFRPSHSCETALVGMVCQWLESINQGSLIGAVMVDFKKAFDLVDHEILLKKLRHYRLTDQTVSWFSSYLTNRKQNVSLNNAMSEDEVIIDGVPQGSILGPLLFLLFINDLPLYTESSKTDMYADDTTLYTSGKTTEEITDNLQIALDNLDVWCKCNGMIINTAKTKVMLITTHQKRASLANEALSLTLNSVDLTMISNDKTLGVVIDHNLTWSNHIDKLCKKMASNLWLLSRIKNYLSRDHRVQFYKTYIQPHIDYCNIIWGGTSHINLDRVFRLQKRACKIILDYNVNNIMESMQDLKILNIFDRINLRRAKFMYKVSRGEVPQYVNEMFQQKTLTNNAPQLRSNIGQTFVPPRPSKEIFKQSITYSGPIIWNTLPNKLRAADSMNQFHNHYIKWTKGSTL